MDAYIALSIRVGAAVQKQPNHLQMTLTGGVVKRTFSKLRETNKV